MPYIKEADRTRLAFGDGATTPGELNFELTEVLKHYMKHKGLSYQTINDIVGVLEGAKLEFYRRVAAPYENAKMAENGDVYS